jgi:hypothetical protein
VALAKHLDSRDINAIVNLIRGWQEPKLSWSAICEAAEPLVGKLPSRQSLNSHEAIVTAYQTKKEALKGRGPKNPRPASLNIAAARIVNLESEIEELKEREPEVQTTVCDLAIQRIQVWDERTSTQCTVDKD